MSRKLLSRREVVTGSAATLVLLATTEPVERWPEISINPKWVQELNERFAGSSGTFHDDSYPMYLQDYASSGDYLNWGAVRSFENDDDIFIADNGLPKVKEAIYREPYWNPVTLCHYALVHYGRMLRGRPESRGEFFKAADKLIELQRPDGGFPYPARPYRDLKLAEGWISAMAQGNALSVFYRATLISDNSRYRLAGERAYASLMTPTSAGGPKTSLTGLDRTLSLYLFLAEYPTDPIDYTLNGYMFALLGLFDWSHISSAAAEDFARGVETLQRLLPYHDIDGFSTYDLSHVVLKLDPYVAPFYLGIHVYLLHALASVTNGNALKHYERKWAAKIDEMNKPLRITAISSGLASPQQPDTAITFRLRSEGGSGGQKLYQFAIRSDAGWMVAQPFSPSDSFVWSPKQPGSYIVGFYAKNTESPREFDNFRYQAFVIVDKPAS